MILRSPTEHENGELRHAGMDGRHPGVQDASGDIHVGLIPALHAGMTESRVLLKVTEAPPAPIFKGGREGHEDWITEKHRILKNPFSSFVPFVCFVVMTPRFCGEKELN
jgi:hypothetical protein